MIDSACMIRSRASSSRSGALRALAELDRRRGDRLLAGDPPVDGVAGHPRRLLGQVEGAHGGHAPRLRLGVGADPGVQVDQGSGRVLDRQLAELDRLGQHDLLLGGQEGDLADLLEVHADRVVDPDQVGGERVEVLVEPLALDDRGGLLRVEPRLGDEGRVVVRVEHLDAALLGGGVELLDLAGVHLRLRHGGQDLVVGDEAVLAALGQELVQRGAHRRAPAPPWEPWAAPELRGLRRRGALGSAGASTTAIAAALLVPSPACLRRRSFVGGAFVARGRSATGDGRDRLLGDGLGHDQFLLAPTIWAGSSIALSTSFRCRRSSLSR